MSDRDELQARVKSDGGWGVVGSVSDHWCYVIAAPNRRRKCHCGCGGRATHLGRANGLTMSSGCQLSMRRWARDANTRAAASPTTYEEER